ncbi:MAG: RagB/SusD family nutrient uptake outer membrane protein [Bacteroidetes bacterium]|nr:RagB/SusD family nutrient uptake outer membrane protein [Bacteroidota bacterium]
MKHQIKLYLGCLLVLFIVIAASCTKKLDILPEGSPSSGSFWTSENDAISGENAMYELFDDEDFYGRGTFWFVAASDDMVIGRANAQANNIKNFNPSFIGGSYTDGQWRLRYKVIKRANDVIFHVPSITMDANLKNRILGEAYFLSGLMYFQLAANYGDAKAGVPIANRENPSDASNIPRAANVNQNYDYIISDLKTAASLLPYFDSYSPADYGRAHKTAAWAYLSKVYLYKKDYANAELYADSVINSGKHHLLTNFSDVFTIANNWSSEYIWSATSTGGGSDGWGSILPGCMLENKGWGLYNGWGYYTPTQELYNAYLPNDTRLSATILKPGDQFMYFGQMRTYSSTNSLSGYQFRKYMEPYGYANPIGTYISSNGDHPTTSLNVPLLRYAEVILIKAEAALMQNKNADTYINMIRERAGLLPVQNADMNELKLQRRCELAGEWSDRHRDLVRWGDAQAVYAQPLHGVTGSEIWPARTFNPDVNDVWPVPQSDIDNSNGVIKQSQGW